MNINPIAFNTLTVDAGGEIDQSTNLTINSSGGITNDGIFAFTRNVVLNTDLVNTATLRWTSGSLSTTTTASILNDGSFDITGTNLGNGTVAVVNRTGGTISASGTGNFDIPNLTNEAGATLTIQDGKTLRVISGTLTNAGTVNGSGQLFVQATTINANGGTLGGGNGTMTLQGTVTVAGSAAFAPAFGIVNLNNGNTLAGSGGAMSIPAGTTLGNVGTVTIGGFSGIANAGTVQISGNLLLNNDLTNGGTLNWVSGSLSTAGSASILNDGDFNITGLNIGSNTVAVVNRSGGTMSAVGTGNVDIPVLTNDAGATLTIQDGKNLRVINGTLTNAGTVNGTGTLFVSATTINANGGTLGGGNGTMTLQGAVTVAGSATFAPAFGSVNLNNVTSLTGSGGAMSIPAGTALGNVGTVTIGGFSGIANAGTVQISGNLVLNSDLTNAGTINWIGGILSTAGAASILNDGNFEITGNNLGSGTVAIVNRTGGTLSLAGGNVTTISIDNLDNRAGATTIIGTGKTFLVAGTNDGNIVKNGLLRINGNRTFVNDGTITGTGTFSNFGTYAGTGSVAGQFDSGNGSKVEPGDPSGCLTFTNNVNFISSTTLNVEVGGITPCTDYDRIVVNGTATLSNTVVNVTFTPGANFFQNDRIVLIDAGTLSGTLRNNLNTSNIPGLGTEWEIEVDEARDELVLINVGTNLRTVTSIATGNWNNPSTWDIGRAPEAGDNVVVAAGHKVTMNITTIAINTLTVDAGGEVDQSTNLTINSSGGIINNGIFAFTGNVVLNTDLVNAATLRWTGGVISTTGSASILNDGTFDVTGTKIISGAVAVVNRSGGTISAGGTGTVEIFNLTNDAGATLTIQAGKTLRNNGGTLTNAGAVNGTGTLIVQATTINANGGTFGAGGGLMTISNAVTVAGSAAFVPAFGSVNLTNGASLTGSGGAMSIPAGTTLSNVGSGFATNTIGGFSGIANAGTIEISDELVLNSDLTNGATINWTAGPLSTTGSASILNDGSFNITSSEVGSGAVAVVNRSGGTMSVAGTANVDITELTNNAGATLTIQGGKTLRVPGGTLTNAGTVNGTGTLFVSASKINANGGTFGAGGGLLTIDNAVTVAGSAAFLPSFGSVNLTNGASLTGSGGAMSIPAGTTLSNVGSGFATNTIGGFSGIVNAGTVEISDELVLNSDLTNGATINWTAGGLSTTGSASILNDGTFNITGNNLGSGAVAVVNRSGATLSLAGSNATTITIDNFDNQNGATTIIGTGKTFLVAGTNAGNIVKNGSLRVNVNKALINNGSITGTGTFSNFGTYAGTGSVAGQFDSNNGSKIEPGNPSGCLTFTNNLNLINSTTLNVEVGGITPCTDYDRIVVNGTATLSNTVVNVTFTPGANFFQNDRIVLIDAGTLSGTLNNNLNTSNIPGLGTEWQIEVDEARDELVLINIGTNLRTVTSIATGNWNNPSTWDIGRAPEAGDNVVVAAGHKVTMNITTIAINTLTVDAGGEVDQVANLTINSSGGITNNGIFAFTRSVVLNTDLVNTATLQWTSGNLSTTGAASILNDGSFDITGTNLGNGTVAVVNRTGGTISASGTGNFDIPNLTNEAGATLTIQDGKTLRVISGTLTNAGTVNGSGQLFVQATTINANGGTLGGGNGTMTMFGEVTVAGSATFAPAFGSVNLNNAASLTGSGGAMSIPAGTTFANVGTVTIGGFSDIANSGTFRIGGNLVLNSDLTNAADDQLG